MSQTITKDNLAEIIAEGDCGYLVDVITRVGTVGDRGRGGNLHMSFCNLTHDEAIRHIISALEDGLNVEWEESDGDGDFVLPGEVDRQD
jgi:hypothetical protein